MSWRASFSANRSIVHLQSLLGTHTTPATEDRRRKANRESGRQAIPMSWFRREDNKIEDTGAKTVRTEGLWIKCESCEAVIFRADLEANQMVCPKCGYHFKIGARARIDLLLEPGYELVDLELKSTDPLHFTDLKPYRSRLSRAQTETGLN